MAVSDALHKSVVETDVYGHRPGMSTPPTPTIFFFNHQIGLYIHIQDLPALQELCSRSWWLRGLRPLAYWNFGFESRRGHLLWLLRHGGENSNCATRFHYEHNLLHRFVTTARIKYSSQEMAIYDASETRQKFRRRVNGRQTVYRQYISGWSV